MQPALLTAFTCETLPLTSTTLLLQLAYSRAKSRPRALPADFGTQLWTAATSEESKFEFEGLSGAVRFDERGDRDQLTANIQLFNIRMLQAADGASGTHEAALVASYQGTREVPGFGRGSMSASGVVFNGADTPPKDLASFEFYRSVPVPHWVRVPCCCPVRTGWCLSLRQVQEGEDRRGEAGRWRKTWQRPERMRNGGGLMAIIFHELRNPLNGVVAHLRLEARHPQSQQSGCRAHSCALSAP